MSFFSNDAEIAYKKFQTKFTLYYEKNLTLITKKRKKKCKKPWLNFELLKLIEGKNKQYIRYCKVRSNTNKTKFHEARNRVNKLRKKARRNYFAHKFNNSLYW